MKFRVPVPQAKLEEWCAALESGTFQQGPGTLCAARSSEHEEFKPMSEFIEDHDYSGAPPPTEFRHCCLGVFAEVMGIPRYEISGQTLEDINTDTSRCPSLWLGPYETLEAERSGDWDLDEQGKTLQFILTQLNDGHKSYYGQYSPKPLSFAEIAMWIRENVEGDD